MRKETSLLAITLLSVIVSLGILGSGFFIGKGFYNAKATQPYITVKGLAERVVKADLAVWTITYSVAGDDVTTINNELFRQQTLVLNFLKNNGFSDQEISLNQIKLTDRFTNEYNREKPPQRYFIKGGIKIRSNNVDRVSQASQLTGDLVKQGLALGEGDDSITNPTYYFTQLNLIRPAMLSEATDSAYKVAAQFAKDTRSELGAIRRANQGVFEITSPDAPGISDSNNAWQIRRDEQGAIYKKIRLVSTMDYFLSPSY